MEATGRTALYRLYDTEDRLLYVGISVNPDMRWRQHANDKLWWSTVSRKEVEWFETRPEACEAEVRAIQSEQPLYNVADAPGAQWGDAKKHQRTTGEGNVRQVATTDGMWRAFGESTKRGFTNRADALRGFMAWYAGWEGARRPIRPEPPSR